MKIKKNGKTINLTESDIKILSKRILKEGVTFYEKKTIEVACPSPNTLYKQKGDMIPKLQLKIDGKELSIILDDRATDSDKEIVEAFCLGKKTPDPTGNPQPPQ